MASFLHPVGPLPPSVYWRRRAVLLGIPLVLILAVAYSCGGGSNAQPVARSTATPPAGTPSTGTGVIEPSVMPTGTAGAGNYYPPVGPSGSAGASPSAGAGAGGGTPGAGTGSGSSGSGSNGGADGSSGNSSDCLLALTLTLDHTAGGGPATYSAGQDPQFRVAAKNNGAGNCLLDVSGKGIVITVTQPGSSTPVWTSSDCATSSDKRALGPGDAYQDDTTWQRIRSQAGCPKNEPSVGTGTYVVTATADGVTAASIQFVLQ